LNRDETDSFIKSVRKKLNTPLEGVLKSTKGRYGGTYAHWQIALAYAKYLSPEFHIWCNEVVRDRFIEMRDPDRKKLHFFSGKQSLTFPDSSFRFGI
jgi:hypothetical protein